jgi:hypothetical protein
MSTAIDKIEVQIARVQKELMALGPMRPGSLSRQYKIRKEKKQPFYQLSYTHKMKSRSEYVRPENVQVIRKELANFKKFRKLIDRWVDLALKMSQMKSKSGVHAKPE